MRRFPVFLLAFAVVVSSYVVVATPTIYAPNLAYQEYAFTTGLDSTLPPYVRCNPGGSNVTLTLPACSAATDGKVWTMKKATAGAGNCILAAAGSNVVNDDGTAANASVTVSAAGGSVNVICIAQGLNGSGARVGVWDTW